MNGLKKRRDHKPHRLRRYATGNARYLPLPRDGDTGGGRDENTYLSDLRLSIQKQLPVHVSDNFVRLETEREDDAAE